VTGFLTVVVREYSTRVRSKAFLIGTLLAPLFFAVFLGVSVWLGLRTVERDLPIALVDRTGVLERALQSRLAELGVEVQVFSPPSEGEGLDSGQSPFDGVADGRWAGVLELNDETLETGRAVWWGGAEGPSLFRRVALQQALGQAVLEHHLARSEGAARPTLLGGGELEIRTLEGETKEANLSGMVFGLAGAFLLYVALLIYGAMVLRSVLEEKSGRIVEILLSSVRPWELLLGKILGVGAVGLTQLLVWIGLGAGIWGVGWRFIRPGLDSAGFLERLPDLTPEPSLVAFFAFSFLVGYFLYASVFAAVGSLCSTEEEAQHLQLPVVMVILVPFLFLMPTLEDPGSNLAVGFSLVPFFAPVLMFARLAVSEVPTWQIVASSLGMLVALGGTAGLAGRIYKTGILMQGKRPTLPEIWRWIREG
jgi:ABC-2 type transport system permease protein